MKLRSNLLKLLWLGLAGAMLLVMAVTIWQSRETLLVLLQEGHYEYLVWTFIIYALTIGTIAVGWHLIMSHLAGQRDFILNLKIYVYTLAARRLPGTLWYIAGRAILYQRLGIPKRVSSLASGVEVILSIVSGVMVGVPALIFQFGQSPIRIMLFILLELIGLTLLYPAVLVKLLAYFGHKVEPGAITIPRVLAWLGAYGAMWVGGGVMTSMIILILYPLPPTQIGLVVSLWALSGAISFISFLLPNGLGVPEIALSVLLSSIIPLPIAITTAILVRVLTTIFDIMWSSLFLWERNKAIIRQ